MFVEVDVDMPQYLDEAEWVDGLATHDRRVLRTVVSLRLERGAAIEPEMARVAKLKIVRGVRRLIQNQADPEFDRARHRRDDGPCRHRGPSGAAGPARTTKRPGER